MKPTTKAKQNKKVNPVDFWNELFEPENKIEEDAQMLMFRFLSEVEYFSDLQGISRKELANRIGTSPSYLTQVWRGDKPLNFMTLAKMQDALNISFKVKANSHNSEINIEDETLWHEKIRKYHTKDGGHWCFVKKNRNAKENEEDFYSPVSQEDEKIISGNETKGIAA